MTGPTGTTGTRPPLEETMTSRELLRWYWLRSELAGFARELGTGATGSKQELTERIVARLDDAARPRPRVAGRTGPVAPLPEPLHADTVIPAGQRCTQQLRHYLVGAIGPAFRFDAAMRAFVADGAGRTLGAAVEHWHRTRTQARPDIGPQFELNRFLRQWHHDHPEGSRGDALQAWREHRALPVDARGAPADRTATTARCPG